MKPFFVCLLLTFTSLSSGAQDTILKRNSEKIIAKILEINPDNIKFRKFDFLDGPLYTERKSEIKMIIFANGSKEIFEEVKPTPATVTISENSDYYAAKVAESEDIDMWNTNRYRYKGRMINEHEMHNIMLKTKDKKLMALVGGAKDAKIGQYIGFAGIPLGIASYGLLWGSLINSTGGGALGVKPNATYLTGAAICAVAAIACPIASGSFKKKRKNFDKSAVKMYNEKF